MPVAPSAPRALGAPLSGSPSASCSNARVSFGWSEFLTAVALLLILEGLMPFAFPILSKRPTNSCFATRKTLRMIGLSSVVAGILLLLLTD
ncbi:MAG: DUF2065 domain-containing protein [Thiolinea sp.]